MGLLLAISPFGLTVQPKGTISNWELFVNGGGGIIVVDPGHPSVRRPLLWGSGGILSL